MGTEIKVFLYHWVDLQKTADLLGREGRFRAGFSVPVRGEPARVRGRRAPTAAHSIPPETYLHQLLALYNA